MPDAGHVSSGTRPTISVIIVTYNSAAHLRPTLEALFAQTHPSFEAILLDNASTDDSLAIAREFAARGLRVIAGTTNRGFAGGNNDAVAVSRGELVVLLNPDAVMESPDTLAAIERMFARRADLGVLGAKLLAPDGRTIMHMGGTIGLPAHCTLFARGEPDGPGWQRPLDVEFVIGALFAVRRTVWDRLQGFDEFFNPAYYEDTDFCWRARRLGLAVVADPAVRVLHHENVSTTYRSESFYWMHHKGRLWLMAKNLPWWQLPAAAWAEARWLFSPAGADRRHMMWGLYGMVLRRFVKRRVLRLTALHERKITATDEHR